MTAAICIVGSKNAGKTSLIERLLPELIARGRRVATIKHDAHDFEIDLPGKDTWRHRQAGSGTTIIASSTKVAMVRLTEREAPLEELLRLVDRSYDLVLVEGLRRSPLPKILVHRSELGLEPPHVLGEVWAVVSNGKTDVAPAAPRFRPDEVAALAVLIEQRLLGGPSQTPAWNLPALLAEAGRMHGHLCPGQVLGVRMAILGCERLGIFDPKLSKRLIAFVETDRCGADAVQTVTGCTLGKRTLKFVDYGKLAATFLDTETGRAVRVAARESARGASERFAPEELDPHQAQLRAYKALPDDELFAVEEVRVALSEADLPGRPHRRVVCDSCGEEVNDGRDVSEGGRTHCRACATGAYYAPVGEAQRKQVRA
ncbi:MAG: molybdopterin-guanine dinucleotide biosynthesis protein B [Chloroflexi bacterium]|nr:molybdopterin-guanine dinucleotide biosynthesis protein B [Chloroflexota bacterium]